MKEYQKHGRVGKAALRSGMDRKTARKYLKKGKLPSELNKAPRAWRTREDPFKEDWEKIRQMLHDDPDLEAQALLEDLERQNPGRYQQGQVRTLQRRIKQWRAEEGPDRSLFFPQVHRPGEALQTDFTCGNELKVMIAEEAFAHLLCHPVLPYSNWEWVTVCQSESMAALKRGAQAAIFQLGHTPSYHQTDHSTAATHNLGGEGIRGFNKRYLEFCDHFSMKPRTTGIGQKEQNGDVEAANGAFKRCVKQRLKLRGNSNFATVAEYEAWLQDIARDRNRRRSKRLGEELAVMKVVRVERLAEFTEEDVRVSSGSTIQVARNTYSVPSRLRGERVRVRIYEDRLEVYYAQKLQLSVPRLAGRGRHRINYRHVVHSMVRKPGAFQRYRYREDLFPALTFRRAYDALCNGFSQRRADIEYLGCLKLSADTMQDDVQAALEVLLEAGTPPTADAVRDLVGPREAEVPELEVPVIDLRSYDQLLSSETREVAS